MRGLAVEPRQPRATCPECRLHAARIGEEAASRYQPPLGPKLRIRLKGGGTLDVCPRCWHYPFVQPDGSVQRSNLVDAGIFSQRQARKLKPLDLGER